MKKVISANEFDVFRQKVINYFNNVNYKSHNIIQNEYRFHSANINANFNIVQAFYGSKIVAVRPEIKSNGTVNYLPETERGAGISFQYLINGKVHVCLYPAVSSSLKVTEDFIILHTIRHLNLLNNCNLIFNIYMFFQFLYLRKYMIYSASAFKPSLLDMLIIGILMFLHPICNGTVVRTRLFLRLLKKIIVVLFTVGFSGFCLSFIPFFSNSTQLDSIKNEIIEIKNNQKKIENKLNLGEYEYTVISPDLNKEIMDLSSGTNKKLDGIVESLDKISKDLEIYKKQQK